MHYTWRSLNILKQKFQNLVQFIQSVNLQFTKVKYKILTFLNWLIGKKFLFLYQKHLKKLLKKIIEKNDIAGIELREIRVA